MQRPFRNWLRTLGAPEDPVATDTSSDWSLMSLVKAIFQKIDDGSLASGIAGAADGVIKVAVAGAIAQVNLAAKRAQRITAGAAASAAQAEGFVNVALGAIAQCANYMKRARTSAIAAAASAVSTAANAVSTAADVVTTAGHAITTRDAANFVSGQAMFGQRAKKDRLLAQAAAVAAAASAASVPTTEQAVLGIQVYS